MQITRPKTVMLGNIPGTDIFRDLHHYTDAVTVPGLLILSIEAPINFANATYLKERLGVIAINLLYHVFFLDSFGLYIGMQDYEMGGRE